MLGWLAGLGFELAPQPGAREPRRRQQPYADRDGPLSIETGEGPGHEVDFGRDEGNDRNAMRARRLRRSAMTAADLDAIVRIDRENTGRDRRDYLTARQAGPSRTARSAASLAAHCDGTVVGYLMARADLGDFWPHRGGRDRVAGRGPELRAPHASACADGAAVRQSGALRVETVETAVPLANTALLGFLLACGLRNCHGWRSGARSDRSRALAPG